jgi:hypothetical protein
MRISANNATSGAQVNGNSAWQQRRQNFQDMFAALKAGDLGGAQKAYAALSGNASSNAAGNANATSSNGPLAQLGQALQAGDLAGAQQAAQALQAARGGHHHHHAEQAGADTANTPAPTVSSTGNGSVGSLLNTLA